MSVTFRHFTESTDGDQSPAERHLARMEQLVAEHPENAAPRRLARSLVSACAWYMQADDDVCDNDEHHSRSYLFSQLEAAGEHIAETEGLVEKQSDHELSLVLQALLDIHLQMAVDWMATVNDAVSLQCAASPDHIYTMMYDFTPTGSQLLARQLVAARQGVGLSGSLAVTNGFIERELRRQWRGMCRETRVRVVEHLVDLAGCVAVERVKHEPRGIFDFLAE